MATKESKRGFASMDPEKAREIHSLGGQTAHRLGKAHIFTPEEAREPGKKGQANSRKRRVKAKGHNRKEQ
jgi:hypothetical protein